MRARFIASKHSDSLIHSSQNTEVSNQNESTFIVSIPTTDY